MVDLGYKSEVFSSFIKQGINLALQKRVIYGYYINQKFFITLA